MSTKRLTRALAARALAIMALLFTSSALFAQVKIGDNPTTINAGSALEIESTNKGLLMPRISLTNTTTWGLAGTAAAGMHVYNTNMAITSTNTIYPTLAAKIGEYYWDGTGWVALSPVGSQSSEVQVKTTGGTQGLAGSNANNFITLDATIFDTGNNKVGNTIVIPSTGLYELTGATTWQATGATGGYGFRLFINNAFSEQLAGSVIVNNIVDSANGRTVIRLNAGDVASLVMVTQQTGGSFTLSGSSFTVIKLSN
jgi:hypothetical protein